MQLTGIHHVTAVTADAPRNVAFYTRTLGMRFVPPAVCETPDRMLRGPCRG